MKIRYRVAAALASVMAAGAMFTVGAQPAHALTGTWSDAREAINVRAPFIGDTAVIIPKSGVVCIHGSAVLDSTGHKVGALVSMLDARNNTTTIGAPKTLVDYLTGRLDPWNASDSKYKAKYCWTGLTPGMAARFKYEVPGATSGWRYDFINIHWALPR